LDRFKAFVVGILGFSLLTGCGGKYEPTVVVDNSEVTDMRKYNINLEQCKGLAQTIDLNSEAATKALAGAAAGGVAVAGVATAVAGAVFLPAVPFILAGSALGGSAWGASVSAKETKQRNKIFETNFLGTLLFCREVAKSMLRRKIRGRMVNFSTVATPISLEGEAVYAASKASVQKFTQIAAKEFAPLGITVNCIGPTPVDTDLISAVPKNKTDLLLATQAIKRLGTKDDILNVIDFFIAKESGFITAQTIYLGGVHD